MIAVASRTMQFVAGPERHTFHACAEHRVNLEQGNVTCFFAVEGEPVRDVDPDDEERCWFCIEP